jgi:hypothetical protein
MAWPLRRRPRRPSKAWPPRILALAAGASCSRGATMVAGAWRNHVLVLFFLCSRKSAIILRWPPRRQARVSTPRALSRRFEDRRRFHKTYNSMAAIARSGSCGAGPPSNRRLAAGAQRFGADSKTGGRRPARWNNSSDAEFRWSARPESALAPRRSPTRCASCLRWIGDGGREFGVWRIISLLSLRPNMRLKR